MTTAMRHLADAVYVDAALEGVSFAGSEVDRAYFIRARPTGAGFSNAYLEHASIDIGPPGAPELLEGDAARAWLVHQQTASAPPDGV